MTDMLPGYSLGRAASGALTASDEERPLVGVVEQAEASRGLEHLAGGGEAAALVPPLGVEAQLVGEAATARRREWAVDRVVGVGKVRVPVREPEQKAGLAGRRAGVVPRDLLGGEHARGGPVVSHAVVVAEGHDAPPV